MGSEMCIRDRGNSWPTRFLQAFSDTLGRYTGPKVHIAQLPGSNPVFLRERNLPLAIRSKVTYTIDEMVKEGILRLRRKNPWATSIVLVLKPDGSVGVCDDFKETVNESAACQSYPLPTLDNMLHKLAQGSIFTKLDLSQAYLQLSLDEETSKMYSTTTLEEKKENKKEKEKKKKEKKMKTKKKQKKKKKKGKKKKK